jgi:pimeloyl-ACP methyl ester carboxylesterase
MKSPKAMLLAMLIAVYVTTPVNAQKESGETTFKIPYGQPALKLFLRHLPPKDSRRAKPNRVVLFIHGATFPSGLAAAFRFDGHSWMDDLSESGFDVWALDFLGYGGSDRYPEMSAGADDNPPLGRATETVKQIASAVAFITQKQNVAKVSLIAHSWGTIPAALFATRRPERIDRLVLFGPITMRSGTENGAQKQPAWWVYTAEDQWKRFDGYLPKGEPPVFEKRHFDIWGPAYLASDSTGVSRTPPGVKIPYGPVADIDEAWNGKLAYDPAKIGAPTLIARGEWDSVTTNEDAHWLYQAMRNSPLKRDVVINRGTHVMHLEESRFQLYREAQTFLEGNDTAKMTGSLNQIGRRSEMKSGNERNLEAAKRSKSISIPGYNYGDKSLATSPISMRELELLEKTVTLSEEDKRYLREAGDALEDQIDAVLDVWRGVINAEPALSYYSEKPDGKPDEAYRAAVRKRFGQWILDTCRRPYDQSWLDYQYEIALRHTSKKKNKTDGANAPSYIPLRYLLAFSAVINTTIRPFLTRHGHTEEEVERMHQAWIKAVTLQVAIWSRAYAGQSDW